MPDRLNSIKSIAFNIIAVLLCVFVLTVVNTTYLSHDQPCLALFSMLGLLLVFLRKPMFKPLANQEADSQVSAIAKLRGGVSSVAGYLDLILIAATIFCFGYIFIQSEPFFEKFWIDGTILGSRAGEEKPLDFVIGSIGLLLIIEATRRAIGWTLPILCGIFIVYGFYGQQMPDWLFPHRGATWEQMSQKSFLQSSTMCVFGIALRVMLKYVFLFVLFGTILEQTGATQYILNVARRMFKGSSGGPAKVAVVSSGLMGSLSGSAVANTATTGTFTIPLMKSSGFKSETAAGIEAAASSGGALMPPVMGAGAYMMLEIMAEQDPSITLLKILQAALIPALLYYTALLLTVHFHAKRIGAGVDNIDPEQVSVAKSATESVSASLPHQQSDNQNPTASANPASTNPYSPTAIPPSQTLEHSEPSWYAGIVFFGSFIILIAMLLRGVSPFLAVSVSLAGIVVLSLFHWQTRLTPAKIYKAFVSAAQSGTALIVAASCVGIILGVVDMSGLGPALPAQVQSLSGENRILALLLLMVSTIILGMGLPSAVCYLLVALTVNSVLTTLETPPLAAHLFIFYFGMMSMVTPPVALAAYAGAAIAKADVIKSAFAAFRFAMVGFALPFAFVLRPELLMLTPENVMANPLLIGAHVLTTLVGVIGLAASIAGYGFKSIAGIWRIPLFVCSIAIFFTRWDDWQFFAHLVAVGLVIAMLAVNFKSQED